MVQDVSVSECLSEGWQYFKKYIWLTLATNIIYFVIATGVGLISLIPLIGFLLSIFVAPIFSFGLYLFFLNVARDSNPRIENLFAGFQRYGTLIGFNFLYGGVVIICMLPSIIYGFSAMMALYRHEIGPDNFPWSIFLVFFLNILLVIFGLVRYWLTYFVVMDDPRRGLFDALQRSSDITKYNSHNVILLAIAAWFILIALTIALIIPVLIFGPFVAVAFGRMYEKLKAMHPEPIAQPPFSSEPAPPMT